MNRILNLLVPRDYSSKESGKKQEQSKLRKNTAYNSNFVHLLILCWQTKKEKALHI